MFKRLMMIGLLGISVVAMLGTEAGARVCLFVQGGTCVFWSGSVECDTVADQVGSVQKHPKIACDINQQSQAPIPGLIACANPGAKGKTAPGILLVSVDRHEGFGATASIQKSDINNGVAAVDFTASLSGTALSNLNVFCPNTSWTVVGYVPCEADIVVTQSNDTGPLDEVAYQCTLPSCETLGFNTVTHTFERRQYTCCQVGVDCP